MIAAFDVHYFKDGQARAAAVLFSSFQSPRVQKQYTGDYPEASKYVPGAFYRRELPCILNLLTQFASLPQTIIVDGYVMLGERPGLGWHLFSALNEKIPVIGVAKSPFHDAVCQKVFRGDSRKPLFVTAAGMDCDQAGFKIQSMHGSYRLPTLLKAVDQLARRG